MRFAFLQIHNTSLGEIRMIGRGSARRNTDVELTQLQVDTLTSLTNELRTDLQNIEQMENLQDLLQEHITQSQGIQALVNTVTNLDTELLWLLDAVQRQPLSDVCLTP